MTQSASIEWWNKSLDEVGLHSMDKLVSSDASWEDVVASGRADLERAIEITGMPAGPDCAIIEVGCGVGRMSAALGERFGRVLGLDIAPRLIEEAQRLNPHDHIVFEVADGVRLTPRALQQCDVVFSYEVFYYINADGLRIYFEDAFRLLKPGGQFIFQLNIEPIRWKTRLSGAIRRLLYACGIQHWRGWPTGAGYQRYCHSRQWLTRNLTEVGFQVRQIAGTPRQTWVVAVKGPGA